MDQIKGYKQTFKSHKESQVNLIALWKQVFYCNLLSGMIYTLVSVQQRDSTAKVKSEFY